MFKITEEWLRQFSSRAGGWTANQLKALGIEWPPEHGWKLLVIGKEITLEEKLRFEKRIYSKKSSKSVLKDQNQNLKELLSLCRESIGGPIQNTNWDALKEAIDEALQD